jgi:NAD(P)-dependent dehydrogenase (short-subunit alcohol dehydrogenase family)
MRLAGKHALVTGAQQGIGRATVLALAREGADVAINWLDDRPAADKLAQDVEAIGRKAFTVQGDVSNSKEVNRMVSSACAALGGLDILVNNAGVFPRSPFLDLAESEWDQVLDINLKGSFLCAQAVAHRMVADGRGGAIVNISSSSVRGNPLGVHYAASKMGIIGMTRSMALALAEKGIRVNAVAPGITDTAQPRYQFSESQMQEQSRLVPLGSMAQPGDIASILVFLASDESRFITGETIHANGGLYMA